MSILINVNRRSSILQEFLLCPLTVFFFGKMLSSKMLFFQRVFSKRAFCQALLRRLGELNARQRVLNLLQLFTFPAYESSPIS